MIDATSSLLGMATLNKAHSTADGKAVFAGMAALAGKKAMTDAQAETAAKDFESMFVGQMMEQMFGDSVGEDAFGTDETNDVYKSLMMDEYGKQIVKSGGIGIAQHVKAELLKLQEVGHE